MSDAGATAAIIVAGGTGERFGRVGGKQLQRIAGWPVLSWSIRAMDAVPDISVIVVVCPEDRRDEYLSEAIEPLGLVRSVVLVPAGATRQESVANGLRAVGKLTDYVVVHDGARPLVTPELVSQCMAVLRERPEASGVVAGHPSFDTLKIVAGDTVIETPARERYWVVQTPQVFRREALVAAHEAAQSEGFFGTDDASLVERSGGTVLVVRGPRDNVKVTVAEDLAYVSAVLGRRREGLS